MLPLYLVVRGDISHGYQIAQSAHALADFAIHKPDSFLNWHKNSGYIVALEAENENKLLNLIFEAEQQSLSFVSFKEPDLKNQVTSIAFAPSVEAKRFLSTLKLAGRNPQLATQNKGTN